MITSSRDQKGFQAKQEGDANGKLPSTSRQWSAFRNPRIVRVSRSFGGKDRHSKVCTIRGLRDRRIRLSVPTAIQLYDLQDRLGLSQPSKVVDWLLDATKDDIDKLPPLQLPQGFGQSHQPILASHESNASQPSLYPFFDANSSTFMKDGGFHSLGIKIGGSGLDGADQSQNTMAKSKYNIWDLESSLMGKNKDVERVSEKGKWIKTNHEEDNQDGVCNYSAQKLFPLASHSSLPSLINSPMPFNSFCHWDASNLSLSQFGSHGFLSQTENSLNSNSTTVPLPSPLPLSAGSQLFFCPPAAMPPLFPPFPPHGTNHMENCSDSREINHFQPFSSSMKPFSLNVNFGFSHSHAK